MSKDRVRYWRIGHNADLTETGYPMSRTYVCTTWRGHEMQQTYVRELLHDFCRQRFGPQVVYVQGCAPTLDWTVTELDRDEFAHHEPVVWGGIATKTRVVDLDIGSLTGKKIEVTDDREVM